MKKTAVVFTPKFLDHDTGLGHPENSKRLKVVMRELQNSNILSDARKYELIEPEQATIEDLELTHTSQHIQLVKRICELGGGLLDSGDTVVSPKSYEVARYAVGGALKAVDLVFTKKYRNAFSMIRPPGHHAGPYYAMGFCVFNNIAVAAKHLTKRLHLDRVLILDIDSHHGNGTQEIFYHTEKVLYISLHEDPEEFPGTGFVEETGVDKGLGYNVNIPLPFGVCDKTYLQALDYIVVPIIRQYNPEFILLSAGYDGYQGDPVGRLGLSASIYEIIFEKLLDLASTFCEDKLVVLLEGGYNLKQLGKLVASTISKMGSFPYTKDDKKTFQKVRTEKQGDEIIEEIKKVHSVFWSLPR